MRNEFVVFMLLALMPAVYAFNVADIKNNTIVKDNATYNVVGYEQVYIRYDGKYASYTRIFIENQTKKEELEKEIENIINQISSKKNKIEMLREEVKQVQSNKAELEAEISKLNQEIEALKENLTELEAIKAELEAEIKNNFVLSPTQIMSIIILFVVLIASAVIIELLALFKHRETKPIENNIEIE